MREILFKAKSIATGEWVEGYYVYVDYLDKHCIVSRIKNPHGVDFIVQMTEHDVDVNTLCQYTGLIDKNGNKIWENDIVNGHEKRGAAFFQCVVKYNDRKARFDVEAMGCMFPLCLEEYDEDFFMNGLDYEVIGNTFDNPDLLEGE